MNDVNNVSRVINLIDELLPLVNAAEGKFKSARNWGFIDMFGGGFLTDLIKHYKLNSAADIMNEINYLLQQLQNETKNLQFSTNYQMNTMTFATFADFLFDGILADTYMQTKIMSSLEQVRELKRRLLTMRQALSR